MFAPGFALVEIFTARKIRRFVRGIGGSWSLRVSAALEGNRLPPALPVYVFNVSQN